MATEYEINSGENIQDIYFYTLKPVPVSASGYIGYSGTLSGEVYEPFREETDYLCKDAE